MHSLTADEILLVSGGDDMFAEAGVVMGGFSAVACGLAMIPTPASPALGAFGVVTGVLGATFGYISAKRG